MNIKDNSVWAGIVVYHPELSKLKTLINALESQVEKIVIFNNGGCTVDEIITLFCSNRFEIIGIGQNIGIAKALNEICHVVAQNSVSYVVTFDQDSAPGIGFVSELHKNFLNLSNSNENVAAVGPVFIDEREDREVLPVFQALPFWIKKINPLVGSNIPINASILITSGMLLNISAWKIVGDFREDYFIDHVDTEWCLRARSKGFKLFVCSNLLMKHELSNEAPKRVFGRLVLKYNPVRRYYAFRNTTALIFTDHTPNGFRVYLFTTICYRFFINLIVDKDKIKSLTAMLTGVLHGLTGKMGEM